MEWVMTNQQTDIASWLERADGERVVIQGTCALGRSPSNHVVLSDDKVSRRHAIIHAQGANEFWLVDLGSSNGTYVNDRRVNQPVQLRDQDHIQISRFRLTFNQPSARRALGDQTVSEKTIMDIKASSCWLLVADIEASTVLSRRLSADELPMVTGRWFSSCKQIIDECGGTINKYLGDGFFAYWNDRENSVATVSKAMGELRRLQMQGEPPFRLVLHLGQVFMGGVASLGEESLSGSEVNFVFRMEKLAGSLGVPCLLSSAAQSRLHPDNSTTEAGRHSLPGFRGEFLFFTLV
jgi:adenylate cyclase